MSRQDDLKELIAEHYRHLHVLKQQEAGYGSLNVPTHIVTQIQDREAAIEKLQTELAIIAETETESPQPKLAASPVVAMSITPTAAPDPKMVALRTQLRIFLCHANEDKPRVIELYHHLKDAGYRPWLDKFDLLPGQKWQPAIKKIITDLNTVVLVCFSNNSITKRGMVQQEIQWALDILERMPEETIYLIPVRLEACLASDQLSDLHWVNMFEPEGFEYLKRALDYEIGKRQETPKPEPVTPAKARSAHSPKSKPAPTKPLQIPSPQLKSEQKETEPTSHLTSSPRPPSISANSEMWKKTQEAAMKVQEKTMRSVLASIPSTLELKRQAKKKEDFELELILIPAGEFLMGSDPQKDKQANKNEQPQHRLSLSDYYIAKTPVTNAQYAAFVQAMGHDLPEHWKDKEVPRGKENHPVVYISWGEAVAYCRWLAQVTGKPYRLPTEAEWEKAARGSDGRIYPWGNEWGTKRCNTYYQYQEGKGDTTPVGAYPAGASPYGVLDMAGNVWEWCATKRDKPYPYDVAEDEWTDDYLKAQEDRMLRGGSWINNENDARCVFRRTNNPLYRVHYFGFRVVSPIL